MGSGKSTIAQKLQVKLNAKVFSIDQILDEHKLTADKEDGYISQKSFLKANEIIIPEAKKLLADDIPVIFDGNFYWKSQIEDLVKRLDYKHEVFTLKASLELCLERDQARKRIYGKDTVNAVFKKSTQFSFGKEINVNKPIEECVSEIMSLLPKKVYVFIDASNLWEAQKAKGRMFDYEKLKTYLKNKFSASSIEIFYYTAYPAEGTREQSQTGKHKFFTYLKKGLGFTVRKKELKRIIEHNKLGDSIQEKGNMDVEMTIDAIHFSPKYDTAILFTGDSDFLALVNYLRNGDKKVFIFSSKNNISQELRTGGDGYFDVLNIQEDIWGRDLKYKDKP